MVRQQNKYAGEQNWALDRLVVQFLYLVLFSLFLGFSARATAQDTPKASAGLRLIQDSEISPRFTFVQQVANWDLLLPLSYHRQSQPPKLLRFPALTSEQPLPNYDADHLAFFCRLELRLEKATKIPVRFRLGDVQQVDYLEGKFTGWRYGY